MPAVFFTFLKVLLNVINLAEDEIFPLLDNVWPEPDEVPPEMLEKAAERLVHAEKTMTARERAEVCLALMGPRGRRPRRDLPGPKFKGEGANARDELKDVKVLHRRVGGLIRGPGGCV